MPTAADYAARKPVLQLVWWLEYADDHATAEHLSVTDAMYAELGSASVPV
jgi:hypothetical protein